MALASQQVSVSTTAVNLLSGFTTGASIGDQLPIVIRNTQASGGTTLYIGGPGVTTGNGFPLYPQESIPAQLLQSDVPYGIVGGGTITVAVLVGRQ